MPTSIKRVRITTTHRVEIGEKELLRLLDDAGYRFPGSLHFFECGDGTGSKLVCDFKELQESVDEMDDT